MADDFQTMGAREFEAWLKGLLTEPNSRVARYFARQSEGVS